MQRCKLYSILTIVCLFIFSIAGNSQSIEKGADLLNNLSITSSTVQKGANNIPIPEIQNPRCGSTEYREWLQAKYPKEFAQDQAFEDWIEVEGNKWKANKANKSVVLTIPIIFHIIHNGGAVGSGDNISGIYVDAQIQQLNNDFRKILGTSGSNTHPAGADVEIEFCAATIDPSGATLAEPGINRVNRNTAGFTAPPYSMNYTENNVKPALSWNPNDYFNVWSLNLSGGLLGYAQFPSNSGLGGLNANGGAANTDGCVVLHSSIGSSTVPFPGGAPFNQGRTLTHEAGHWLGLLHIWGDSNCGDDFCNDTPTQQTASGGCPNTTTCDGINDMVENYMDYSNDACMNIFTNDQKVRMMAVMANSPRRMSLPNSTVCGVNQCANFTITASSTDASCAAGGTGTVVPAGGTTTYTFSWSSGGAGATETGLVPGTYQVTVTDGAACVLTESITVSNTCTAICDTISNFDLVNDTGILYLSDNVGYVAGHNGYGDIAKSDFYDYSTGIHSHVKGGYFGFGTASASSPTATFNVTVWDGTGGTPGAVLSTVPVLYQDVVTLLAGGSNIAWVEFPAPVALAASKQFFLGIEFAYNPLDTIALITNTDPEGTPNTAWEEWGGGGGWFAYDDPSSWTLSVAHLISPVLGTPPSPAITPLSSTVCQNDPINFSATGTNIDMYEWQFPGGTPSMSTLANPTVSYANAGSYNVTFIAFNGCMADTSVLMNSVVVNSCGCTFPIANSATPETCFGNDGTGTVIPSGGTPPYSFSWDAAAGNQTTGTAVGLTAGQYSVSVTDAICTQVVQVTVANSCVCNMTLATTTVPESCTGMDGSATVTPTNGTGPFVYQWDANAANQATATANNLVVGGYVVTVTDATGCAVTASAVVGTSCSTGCDTISNFDFVNYSPALFNAPAPQAGYISGTNTFGDLAKADYYAYAGANTHLKGGYFYFEGLSIANPATSSVDVTVWDGTGGTPGAILGTKTELLQDIQTFLTDANTNMTSPLYWVEFDNYINLPASNEFFLGFQIPTTPGDTIAVVTSNVDFVVNPAVAEAPSPGTAWEQVAGSTWNTYEAGWGFPFSNLIVPVLGVAPTAGFGPIGGGNTCINEPIQYTNTSTDATTYEWQFPGGMPSSSTMMTPPPVIYPGPGSFSVTLIAHNDCMSDTLTIAGFTQVSGLFLTGSSTDVTCAGNDGTATVMANGAPPYTYQWDVATGNQTVQTAVGLAVGQYQVTVVDGFGCEEITQIGVADGCTCSLTAMTTTTDASCFGDCDGTATVTTNATVPNPVTHMVNVSSNQFAPSGLTITQGDIVTWTNTGGFHNINGNLASYPGNPEGFGNGVGSGWTFSHTFNIPGSYDYHCDPHVGLGMVGSVTVLPAIPTYLWSNGETTATITGLCQGNYTVTATDAGGCTATAIAAVVSPLQLVATATEISPASCNGGSDGVALANTNGGILPYSIIWDNGETTATATACPAGIGFVTVTDANGCQATASVIIGEPTAITVTVTVDNNVSCTGGNDGAATAVAQGGTPGYTFQWDNLFVGQTVNNLSAGQYSVTATDINGCTGVQTFFIVEPGLALAGAINQVTNVSCAGLSDGSANISMFPNSGTPPYTYLWSDGQMTVNAIGLAQGNYDVTITDSNGCELFLNTAITEPAPILLTGSATLENCNMTDGTATVAPAGGTAPYIIQWDAAANNQNTLTATGLASGTYQATVTDSNSCTSTTSISVADNCGGCTLTVSVTGVDETCPGACDGTAMAVPSNGTAPFSYTWSVPTINTPMIGNLCVGIYTVTVVDAQACVATVSITINGPMSLSATVTSTPTTCAGVDGTATAMVTGGTLPYGFQWDSATGNQTTATAVGLAVGSYSLTVTDGNGCMTFGQANVTDGCVCNLLATTTVTNATCAGSDGTATAVGTLGTMPYTYMWDANTGNQTTMTAVGLNIGTYVVTISDANGCISTAQAAIADGCVCTLTATAIATNATCAGSDGTATAVGTLGTMPYTYMWDANTGNQTTMTATGLAIGGYVVTITDANGCTAIAQTAVADGCNCTLATTTTFTNTTCAGNDGTATAIATGGTMPYFYLWDAAAGNQTTMTATGLPVGVYSVTVADVNGCIALGQVGISDGCVCTLTSTITTTNATCAGSDGTATAVPAGGTMPYTYMWDANTGNQTTATAVGLPIGGYVVTITDANGCTSINQAGIADGCVCALTATGNTQSETCFGNDGTATVVAALGTMPYVYQWDAAAGNQTTQTAVGLTAGSYSVLVTDANACTTSIIVQVTNNCNCTIVVSVGTTNATCGDASGTATANPAGGTAPYTFQWSNSAVGQVISGLVPGTYFVTVSDGSGCSTVGSQTVGDSGSINAQATGTDLTCNGDNSGSATATNTGVTYNWSNGGTTATINGLPAGNYTVTVASGTCTDMTTVTINEPAALVANIIAVDDECSQNGGTANGTAFGGVQPYTYLWDNGSTMQSIGGLTSGSYTVTVTDANGCTSVDTEAVVSAANGPVLSSTQTNVTCSGANDGAVDLTVNGGTAPFVYSWNGLNVEDVSGLAPGSYTCVVTDANGCVAVTTVQISEPAPMTLTFTTTPSTGTDGTASVNVFGGNPPYNYTWSSGDTTQVAIDLAPGTYTVIVEDANGCITQGSVTVGMTTSNIDLENLSSFELTPNPTDGIFNVDLGFTQIEQVEFAIYNVLGQAVLSMEMEGINFSLPMNLSSEASGTYFAIVKTDKGQAVKRFIITE